MVCTSRDFTSVELDVSELCREAGREGGRDGGLEGEGEGDVGRQIHVLL